MAAHYGQPAYSHCMDRQIQVTNNGSRTFYAGEVFDDIQEQVLCLDCLQTLTEADVRDTWNGYSTYAATLEEQDGNQ